jgi:hypothetical protein
VLQGWGRAGQPTSPTAFALSRRDSGTDSGLVEFDPGPLPVLSDDGRYGLVDKAVRNAEGEPVARYPTAAVVGEHELGG